MGLSSTKARFQTNGSVQQNFVEFLQTARNQLFVPFLVLTTKKGVLFVTFQSMLKLRDIFLL